MKKETKVDKEEGEKNVDGWINMSNEIGQEVIVTHSRESRLFKLS